jgi:hypothetical protein
MSDKDWIANLLPYEAQEALKAFPKIDGPLSVQEAFDLYQLKKALKAKAESTYEPFITKSI